MESIKHILDLKPKRQARLWLLLVSTLVIVITSLLAYNRITYEFPLAVGNTGQSALGPPTSAGVGIVFAMIVVASILGFGAILSIFGSLRNVSKKNQRNCHTRAVAQRLSSAVSREARMGRLFDEEGE